MSDEYRLPPPPRSVPLPLVVNLAVGSKIAWLVLVFASIFAWLFCANADLSFVTFRPPYEQAQGTVMRISPTNASENRQTIQRIDYSYRVRGAALTGDSYFVGSGPEVGETVTVEYLADTPQRSRIAGMRRDLWSPWILLLVLFPGACLAVIVFTARSGLRRCRLLRDGLQATGKLIDRQPTNVTINRRPVIKLIYEFDAYDGGKRIASMRTHQPERFQDAEPRLYDPLDPSRSMLIDSLPVRPQLDEAGNRRL
jgi:hypothetical protein